MASDQTKLPSVWAFPRALSWGPFSLSCTHSLCLNLSRNIRFSTMHLPTITSYTKKPSPIRSKQQLILCRTITDIKLWVTHYKLQLNDSKTESLLVKSHRLSVNFPLPSSMRIGNSEVLFVSSEKNLGVTLDCNLNMTQHVLNICRSAYIELRQIGSIRHLLTAQATQTLICVFILSRFYYCNCLFAGCPQFLIDRLQKVQNAAARLICRAKKLDHVQPILQSLHWLPIKA